MKIQQRESQIKDEWRSLCTFSGLESAYCNFPESQTTQIRIQGPKDYYAFACAEVVEGTCFSL